MLRRLFAVASAVSLLLFVVTLAVWVGSCWVQPGIGWTEPRRLATIGVMRGSVFVSEVQQPPGGSGYFGPPHGRRPYLGTPERLTTVNVLTTEWRLLGFEFLQRSPPLTFRRLVVPCWAVALVFAVAPALWYRQHLNKCARRARGLCDMCGYDLRATPGRCPECGAVPAR
jgi:hypothetical protein